MKFKRRQGQSGEPIRMTENTVTSWSCCDCGLVHTVFIDKLRKGRGEMVWFRDDHETARERKRMKK